jgi:hypothetical protein
VKLLAKIGVRKSREKLMAKRKIYSQGEFDGACFLYSVANAIRAVTGKGISRADWQRAVSGMPFETTEFLDGFGTGKLDRFPDTLSVFAGSFARSLRSTVAIETLPRLTVGDITAGISSGKVAIASIDAGDHWLVILDVVDGVAFCACSWEFNSGRATYDELPTDNGHIFNLERPVADLKLWKGPGFLLHRT